MRQVVTFLLLGLVSIPAYAQDQVVELLPECQLLPDYKPDPGVEYQPGVDVHGKAVAPADINASPLAYDAQTMVVPLTVDLAQRLQNPPDDLKLEGTMGYLEIHPNGRVSYNGQDLTSQVYVLCGKQPIPANGQSAEDVIKYEPVPAEPASKKVALPPIKPQAVQPVPVPKPVEKKGELIEGEEYREEGTHE